MHGNGRGDRCRSSRPFAGMTRIRFEGCFSGRVSAGAQTRPPPACSRTILPDQARCEGGPRTATPIAPEVAESRSERIGIESASREPTRRWRSRAGCDLGCDPGALVSRGPIWTVGAGLLGSGSAGDRIGGSGSMPSHVPKPPCRSISSPKSFAFHTPRSPKKADCWRWEVISAPNGWYSPTAMEFFPGTARGVRSCGGVRRLVWSCCRMSFTSDEPCARPCARSPIESPSIAPSSG